MKTALALLAILCTLALPARAQELKLSGQRSEIKDARMVVVRTPAEFQTLWKQHDPAQTAPAVDFDKQIVVAVFLGQVRTGGTRVELTLVPMDAKTLVVFWKEVPPSRSSFSAQVISTPFEMVAVPRSYASVTFERNLRMRALTDGLQGFAEKPGFDQR